MQSSVASAAERLASHDASRPPDWRFRLARRIADGEPSDPGPLSPPLERATAHLAGQRKDAVVQQILELFQRDDPVRWSIEAWLLCGLSDAEIAARAEVPAKTIGLYEELCFNVRDCLGATDHLLSTVVEWAHVRGFQDGELRQFWAWVAMAGKTYLVDTLVRSLQDSLRPGETPALSVYLRKDVALALQIQGWIALLVIPRRDAGQWFVDLQTRLQEAGNAAEPGKARETLYRDTIEVARHVLRTGSMPQQRQVQASGDHGDAAPQEIAPKNVRSAATAGECELA